MVEKKGSLKIIDALKKKNYIFRGRRGKRNFENKKKLNNNKKSAKSAATDDVPTKRKVTPRAHAVRCNRNAEKVTARKGKEEALNECARQQSRRRSVWGEK